MTNVDWIPGLPPRSGEYWFYFPNNGRSYVGLYYKSGQEVRFLGDSSWTKILHTSGVSHAIFEYPALPD